MHRVDGGKIIAGQQYALPSLILNSAFICLSKIERAWVEAPSAPFPF